jgi:hypothetical protein
VAIGIAEPLHITGNIFGIAAAVVVWLVLAKPDTPHILVGVSAVLVLLNMIHAAVHGFFFPSLVFIGVALLLLLPWAQILLMKDAIVNGYQLTYKIGES